MAAIDANRVSEPLRRNWVWIALFGALLVLLGLWAAVHPLAASVATLVWLGALFAVAGLVEIMKVWSAPGWRGALWHLGSGAIYLFGGLWMLFRPLGGMIALVLLVAITLIGSGAARLVGGIALRPADGWLWFCLGGLVSIAAGVALLLMPPGQSLLVPGLLVGLSMLVEGVVLILLALAGRRARRLRAAA
jgi:uncharacterized membrane protein HdeD (DUF308 family)